MLHCRAARDEGPAHRRFGRAPRPGRGQHAAARLAFVAFACALPGLWSAARAAPGGWEWRNPLPQGNSLQDVCLLDENVGFAVGDGGTIIRSVDGGLTWSLVRWSREGGLYSVWFGDGSTGVAVGFGPEGTGGLILRSTDGGATWQDVPTPIVPWLLCVHFADASAGAAVGWGGIVLWTMDGGATWADRSYDHGSPLYLEGVRLLAPFTAVAVGTGGTSMAKAQSLGATVIAVSGTTGTTNRTRAIAGISALAKHWQLKYRPIIGKSGAGSLPQGSPWQRANFRGIMMASLPGFIAMALTLAIGKIPGLGSFSTIFDTMIAALPVIVAVVAAKQVSGLDEVAIVAGVVAGTLSVNGGILGGIVGGILAGALVPYLLTLCFNWRFPATTANIVAGGLSGLASGLLVYFLIAPVALWAGNGIRELINLALGYSGILAGAVAGLLIWPAIMGGVYHAAILPIVLLEMEKTGNSFLGAIDMTGLVMVSAGITLANILYPRTRDEATVAAPGFLVNVGFGTFVEAAYPFMFSDRLVFIGALLSGALSGAVVGMFGVRGTAYVPSVVAPAMSNHPMGFLVSMLIAMGSAFLFTVVANRMAKAYARAVDIGEFPI